jgi:hypothetical protein
MPPRFPDVTLKAIGAAKYLYVRAGAEHRFIAVWTVVVAGRRRWS